ncbi:MAG TPA: DUF1844 domain-containing protein [Candidatus Marinimicrobia bacterium]|nr:DUF1844 domain-containing protein [Candidatus Neomarinimicrobiota bacterium]
MAEDRIDQKKVLFLGLIQSFITSAWIQMGKQKSPITGDTAVNLKEARFTIDMLEMIEEKTKGNLSEEEKQILAGALSELKINFVDLKIKQDKHPEKQKEPKPENTN